MEQLVFLVIASALVALLGANRNIGYGWSFVLCLFITPIIGLIIILFSKKKDSVDFVDMEKNPD
jgi:ABC-type multidrug transport system permease subunit